MRRIYNFPRRITPWLLASVLGGCGLFKQTVKTTDSAHQNAAVKTEIKMIGESEAAIKTLALIVDKDSAGQDFHLLLWPKGRFTFSTEKGFEGEADSMKISGESWAFENHSEILSTDEQQKSQLAVTEKQDIKTQSVQEKSETRSFTDYKMIIGALIVLLLVLFLIFRKRL